MEKILTQLFDLPKMINSKLPMNNFNSMVEDSEHNVANWTGKFYTVSALVILLTSLMSSSSSCESVYIAFRYSSFLSRRNFLTLA